MIWYSHVNEDNRAERDLLLEGPYEKVICITGSGERALSLMDASRVHAFHAVDINREANFLLELKLGALAHLGAEAYLTFCGLSGDDGAPRRSEVGKILADLSPDCRAYWRDRTDLLLEGIAQSGHFERFLARIRPALRAVLGQGFEECFTRHHDAFQKFPFARWKLLRWLFSQRWAYLALGNRDPAFVATDATPALISRAMQRTLEDGQVPNSFMFHLIFKGNLDAMSHDRLPPSLREDVLSAVQKRLQQPGLRIRFHEGDLKALLADWPRHDFSRTFFSLSDILSFADFGYLLALLQLLKGADISVVFRSFLRHGLTPRQLHVLRTRFKAVDDISHRDATGFYRIHHVQI
jgi:S-adenosylmethionine:diacylglycerol 3-amino-3-carboxypropyl transferase